MRTIELQAYYESREPEESRSHNGIFGEPSSAAKRETGAKSPMGAGVDVEVSSAGSRSLERFKMEDESPSVNKEIL
jgi:hypothetical protein